MEDTLKETNITTIIEEVAAGAPGKIGIDTSVTTMIMPGAADNSTPTSLTMDPTGNTATVSCCFATGVPFQTVTVSYKLKNTLNTVVFQGNTLNVWNSTIIPNSATNVSIAAGGVSYNSAISFPVASGGENTLGIDVTIYSDGTGDIAYVIIQDSALTT